MKNMRISTFYARRNIGEDLKNVPNKTKQNVMRTKFAYFLIFRRRKH